MADRISFLSYQPPGVYTQTILSSEGINLSAGFRIPTFVGSADVLIENSDVPVVRGSSKNFPVFVEREDVSSQATGTNSIFKTRFGPVVDPLTFLPTENAENVVITVNGKSTNPLLIDPENNDGQGEIHFTFSPDTADEIFISYYYIVEDTLVENEDLSHQILSSGDKIFYTKNRVIVDELGDITNDVTDIAVKVNGSSATVNALNGTTGQITLATEPGLGATLTVTYTYSNFIDKNDPLPNKFIHSISKVGNVSGRKDYTNGVDYNFSFERSINDVTFHEIAWGNSFALTTMQEDDEKFQYDWIPGDHLSIDVFDRPIFGEVASPVDTTQATTKVFKVQNPITDGSGKGTFLYDPDIDPGIFDFYIGADYSDAISGLNKKEHDITAAVGPVVTGAIDGGNKAFNVAHAELANAVNGTNSYSDEVDAITVTVDGSPVTPLTFDISTGDFTLTDAPVTSVAVAFNYKKL
ncbi:hypothetical protein HN803_04480, partial [candidate division WWE3 bacterium]|nr:hypothetical protein [candidate division WWE3 bacterium]